MNSLPLHRITIVRPFAHYLSGIGASTEVGFRQAGLPFQALEDLNTYVPSQRFWKFVGTMARTEGIEDLGFRVGQAYGADCADPNLTRLLHRSPTLYDGLLKGSAFHDGSTSRSHIKLLQPPFCGYALFIHQPSFDYHHPYFEQINWFGLMALIGMVRVFAGPQWLPDEIGLATPHVPGRPIQEQLPDTRILTSQPSSYIAIENELLSRPPLIDAKAAAVPSGMDYEPVPADFTASLRQALQTYIQDSDLSIEFAAELCNTSKRSLQRQLSQRGTCYSEVLNQARFAVASRLLRNPDIKITDVAHQVGYNDSTHFSRAFKRTAGINPRAYRQAYSH